jgi:hypothetical protein
MTTIVLGVILFSTVIGLNEIEIPNAINYFNSDLAGVAFASPHDNHKHNKDHDPRLYVNSLSYNNNDLTILDSCGVQTPSIPCLLVDPRGQGQEEIFIADSALQSTRTVITVTIIEKDEFQGDIETAPHCLDQFRAVTTFTVSTFNGIHGVFLFCDNISFDALGEEKIFDITYSFIEPGVDKDDDTCDCDRPSNLLLQYDGPDVPAPEDVTVEIYKKEGDVGNPEKLLGVIPVVGGEIELKSTDLSSGKDELESNTVFRIMDGDEQIAVISIHTSCSKLLFISQEFTANVGLPNSVTLTVLDGTDTTGQTTIPQAFCPT